MKYSSLYIAAFLLISQFFACTKKEQPILSSGINEYGFKIPQGSNSYDNRIMDYYNRYGIYMLYKFDKKDAYWSVTKWDSLYRISPADSDYVDKQLTLIDTCFFKYYQDSTLRKYLPAKFLLCKSIKISGVGAEQDAYISGPGFSGFVYETFIANWGSSRILNIRGAKDSTVIFRGNINYSFLRLMEVTGKMGKSDEFLASSDYTTPLINTTQATRYKAGFISTTASTSPPGAQNDWHNYIQAIVQNPYSYLTNASGITASNTSYQGILTPVKDSSGLIRRKYDAIVNYYLNNYNINLQKIGDGR